MLVEQKCQSCHQQLHIIRWDNERSILRCENINCRSFMNPVPTRLYLDSDGRIYRPNERVSIGHQRSSGYYWRDLI